MPSSTHCNLKLTIPLYQDTHIVYERVDTGELDARYCKLDSSFAWRYVLQLYSTCAL
jgi:hypothetical protein